MISKGLISHKILLHLAFVLHISSKNSKKYWLFIYNVSSFAYCTAACDLLDCFSSKKKGILHLRLLITSWKADVAHLMFSSSSPEICHDLHSSLTLNRWCIRQLLKGHAHQFPELHKVYRVSWQNIQKNQRASVPQDLPLTKWITNSEPKMIKRILNVEKLEKEDKPVAVALLLSFFFSACHWGVTFIHRRYTILIHSCITKSIKNYMFEHFGIFATWHHVWQIVVCFSMGQ